MQYQITRDKGVTTLRLIGNVVFEDMEKFRDILDKDLCLMFTDTCEHSIQASSSITDDISAHIHQIDKVVFDLSGLTMIDSSGIGMLIYACEVAGNRGIVFEIRNPCAQVRSLMQLSHLDRFFTIIYTNGSQ